MTHQTKGSLQGGKILNTYFEFRSLIAVFYFSLGE